MLVLLQPLTPYKQPLMFKPDDPDVLASIHG